jgi:hypothetical protein
MAGRPVSANAGTLSGPLGTGQCGAKPVGRLVKHQRPGCRTRLKPPLEPAL